MDPFLELSLRWPIFHGWFVRELARLTVPSAESLGCWIDVERSVYQREPTGELVLVGEPDQLVGLDISEMGPVGRTASAGGVALADPEAVHEIVLDPDQLEQYKQDYLVVRELGRFSRILAVVEVLSFANKGGSYAPKYREKRSRFLTSRAHFMEIDFLRAESNPSRELFPELEPTPYFIFLARKSGMGRHEEGYPLRLREPLPVVGLPLTPDRPNLPFDLQEAFRSAYSLSMRRGRIDYENEAVPDPPLGAADQAWVRDVLKGWR
jgi:hypothetical protein